MLKALPKTASRANVAIKNAFLIHDCNHLPGNGSMVVQSAERLLSKPDDTGLDSQQGRRNNLYIAASTHTSTH